MLGTVAAATDAADAATDAADAAAAVAVAVVVVAPGAERLERVVAEAAAEDADTTSLVRRAWSSCVRATPDNGVGGE